MRLSDSLKLALTKFRKHRIRLTLSFFVLIFLFSIIIALFVVSKNAKSSLKEYVKSGLNDQFLVLAANSKPNPLEGDTPAALIDIAERLYDESKRQAESSHNQLGTDYTKDESLNPVETFDGKKHILPATKLGQTAISEYMKRFHEFGLDDLNRIAKAYQPQKTFTLSGAYPLDGNFFSLEDGKEDFSAVGSSSPKYINTYFNNFIIADDELISPFLLDDISISQGEIPIIVNYKIAEQLMGLDALQGTSDLEIYERHLHLRKNANSSPFSFCFRNTTSQSDILTARSANQNQYSKVNYLLPEESCGAVSAKNNDHSADEETAKNNQNEQLLNGAPSARQELVNFRIVGLVPNSEQISTETSLSSVLRKLLASGIESEAPYIPRNLLNKTVNPEQFSNLINFSGSPLSSLLSEKSYVIKFNSSNSAQAFIRDFNCEGEVCTAEKPFKLSLYGGNSTIINQLFSDFSKTILCATLAICLLSILLLFNIINRAISDSQKEIAIFRAIGFSRRDIAKIYFAFSSIFISIVFLFSLLLGAVAPFLLNTFFAETFGAFLSSFFDTKELIGFNFASFEPASLLAFPLLLIIALFGASLPLLANSRRSLIKSLREE